MLRSCNQGLIPQPDFFHNARKSLDVAEGFFVEKTIKSEIVYQGKFITLRRHDIVLDNGNKTVREIVEHPGAAACVVLNENHEVLLIEQYRKAAEAVLVEIPAGKLDAGETAEICVVREVKEETGITIEDPVKLTAFYTSPGFTDEIMYVFMAYAGARGKTSQMDDESISSTFVPFDDAIRKIHEGKIRDAKSIIGLLLTKEKLYES